MSETEQALPRRIPFWSSDAPEVVTTLGKSKYHLSGFHSHKVCEGDLVMDHFSLLGQCLNGPDVGPLMVTLREPFKTSIGRGGRFKGEVELVLTSGQESSTIQGAISGTLSKDRQTFSRLCLQARAEESVLSFARATIPTSIALAAA